MGGNVFRIFYECKGMTLMVTAIIKYKKCTFAEHNKKGDDIFTLLLVFVSTYYLWSTYRYMVFIQFCSITYALNVQMSQLVK
jgi:hypothetical protein